MVWLGRPAVSLGFPGALASLSSLVMVVAAAALVGFGSYARRIEVRGVLLPHSGLIHITAPATGSVQSMAVHDGDIVAAGAPLYSVNTDTANSKGNTYQQILQALSGQGAILIGQIVRKAQLRKLQHTELQQKIENLQAQVAQSDALLRQHSEFVLRLTKIHSFFDALQKQGIANIHERLQQEERMMQAKGDLERLKGDALRVAAELTEAQSRQANIDIEADHEIDALRVKLSELEQQVVASEMRRSIEVRSPGAGTVTAIAVRPGQTVTAGMPMLTVIPAQNAIQAVVLAPSSAIAFIRPGQRTVLRYSAFPHQRFGTYPGTVTEVSHAALQPEELRSLVPALAPSEQMQTFYRITVTPDRQDVDVSGHPEPLQASMQVEASIILETRPLYQWIIQPLYDYKGA
jgi:membrane fusion protein